MPTPGVLRGRTDMRGGMGGVGGLNLGLRVRTGRPCSIGCCPRVGSGREGCFARLGATRRTLITDELNGRRQ